jgi:hypothetical protein
MTQGFVATAEPYRAVIKPRSADRARIVRQEWEAAKKDVLDPKSMQWARAPEGTSLWTAEKDVNV